MEAKADSKVNSDKMKSPDQINESPSKDSNRTDSDDFSMKLGKNKRDRTESTVGKSDFKTIENTPVKKEHEFYKKGGGPLGKKNQSRILKIHETGQISYWKDKEVKGVI